MIGWPPKYVKWDVPGCWGLLRYRWYFECPYTAVEGTHSVMNWHVCMYVYVLAVGKQKKCAQWLLYVWGCIHIAIYVRPITSPPERPRLQLQPRTKPLDDTSGRRERGGGGGGRNSSSIFGEAKPVDTLQKQIGCFNHRVVTPVADKLWLWEFYFGIRD